MNSPGRIIQINRHDVTNAVLNYIVELENGIKFTCTNRTDQYFTVNRAVVISTNMSNLTGVIVSAL